MALIGRSHYDVFPDLPERWKEAHRRGLAGETLKAEADRFEQAGAPPVWLNWEVRPWYVTGGAIGGLVIFAEDITARKRADDHMRDLQAELLHAARLAAAGEVSAALIHELGQPLTSIGNYIEAAQTFLQQGNEEGIARAGEGLVAALASTNRAGDVLRSLRHYLRREPPETATEPIDVADMVREAVELGLAGAHRRALDMRFALAPGLPTIFGNRIRLQQAIANLVRNAAEAMVEGPRRRLGVSVAATPDGNMVEIAITDSGPGLPSAAAGDDPFHPFVTTKPGGMGLGLPLARRIAEEHGGKLWAEANPDGGSILHFVVKVQRARKEGPKVDAAD